MDYMSYEDINNEIAECYSEIEKAEQRIKYLEAKMKEQRRIEELCKKLKEKTDEQL